MRRSAATAGWVIESQVLLHPAHVISQNSTDATGQASRQPPCLTVLTRRRIELSGTQHRRHLYPREPSRSGIRFLHASLISRGHLRSTMPTCIGVSLSPRRPTSECASSSNVAKDRIPASLGVPTFPDLDICPPAIASAHRMLIVDGTEAQAHVEVKPVAFGRGLARSHRHRELPSARRWHAISHTTPSMPSESTIASERTRNATRQTSGRRRRGPCGQSPNPGLHNSTRPNDLCHGLVVRGGPGVECAAERDSSLLTILGPPAHNDRFTVASHSPTRDTSKELRASPPSEIPKTPEEGGQPRHETARSAAGICRPRSRKAVERPQFQCAIARPPSRQQHTRIVVDACGLVITSSPLRATTLTSRPGRHRSAHHRPRPAKSKLPFP